MIRFKKKISEIIIHCTATPRGRDLGAREITDYHLARGFETIGYHYIIRIDGRIEPGRPPEFIGAHCIGHNDRSIGVAYVGGLSAEGYPEDTRSPAQRDALNSLITRLLQQYPGASIHGHNEFAAKACPCFDVRAEFATPERRCAP